MHLEFALDGIDRRILQADELTQADAGLVEQHHDETVTHLGKVILIDVGIQHGIDGLFTNKLG